MLVLDSDQRFGEDVGEHVVRGAVLQLDASIFHSMADEMEVDVNMLRASVKHIVLGEGDHALVIA